MSSKRLGVMILVITAAMMFVAGSACTSSSSNISSNPNFKQNYNNPTRTPENYAAQQGVQQAESAADLPVTIMQISFEAGRLEVNEAYNIYALVDNPGSKDVRYQWRTTSGKLAPVLDSDKERITSLIDAAPKAVGAPPASPGSQSPDAPVAPAQQGERMVDGKLVPGGVSPDDALKQRQAPSSGGAPEVFREGEPVPPPQLQNRPLAPGADLQPAPPAPVEMASKLGGMKMASNLLGKNMTVKYALLEQVIEEAATLEEEVIAEEYAAETGNPDTAEDVADESAGTDDELESDESTVEDSDASGEVIPVRPDAERLSGIPADSTIEELEKPRAEYSIFDREAGGGKNWPTPWETVSPGKLDAGEKLIEDIQGQISGEMATMEAEAEALSNKAVTMLTVNDPYVRFIPDTAESATISLVIVSAKEIAITEPTVLDVEVLTPQPGVELKYSLPSNGLEPGDTLDVTVNVKNIPDYRRSLLGINFDLNNFELSKVVLGDLFGRSNSSSMFYAQPDKSSGLVTVAVSLDDVIRTVRGSGNAFVLTFEAKAPIMGDAENIGFDISGDPAYRYIQDSAGDNQLPPPEAALQPIQTVLVQPARPVETAPGVQPGMGDGMTDPNAPAGGPPALPGGPPAIQGQPGIDSRLQPGGQPGVGPLAPGGQMTPDGKPIIGDRSQPPPLMPIPPSGDQSGTTQPPPEKKEGDDAPKSATG